MHPRFYLSLYPIQSAKYTTPPPSIGLFIHTKVCIPSTFDRPSSKSGPRRIDEPTPDTPGRRCRPMKDAMQTTTGRRRRGRSMRRKEGRGRWWPVGCRLRREGDSLQSIDHGPLQPLHHLWGFGYFVPGMGEWGEKGKRGVGMSRSGFRSLGEEDCIVNFIGELSLVQE